MRKKGLTSHGLKITAALSMTIDHIGVILLGQMLVEAKLSAPPLTAVFKLSQCPEEGKTLIIAYLVCRLIGRIAFPIFCFLAAEGYHYTRSVPKYLSRLFIFALISELPFDLCFFNDPLSFNYQNVLFTLMLGIAALYGYDEVLKLLNDSEKLPQLLRRAFAMSALAVCMLAARLLHTDYGMFGVLLVFIFGALRPWKDYCSITAICSCAWEITAPLALIPINLYNGEKGRGYKYTFYVFYPAHMILIKLITAFIYQ